MLKTTNINGYVIREFEGKLAKFKRMADKDEIPQLLWLTIFQWFAYPNEREKQLKYMRDCTKLKLIKLGVL